MDQLRPFSSDPNSAAFNVFGDLDFRKGELRIRYRILGPIDELVLPMPVENPQFREELWNATCLEIFLQQADSTAYEEWNFSPSGNWAYFHFQDYRQASGGALRLQPLTPLQIIRNDHQLLLQVDIPLYQTWTHIDQALHYGLTAILQKKSGEKLYWAMHHGADKPDFHLAQSFVGRHHLRQ